MAHGLQQLPADVLLHVFRFLPAADKLNVRACCTYFNQLATHHSLWKHHTACFAFKNGRYNPKFWTSLERRRIRSAVVQGGAKEKHWRQLALTLPSLSSLVVDTGIQECAEHLDRFPKLRCLALRGLRHNTPDTVKELRVANPKQMTRVSLCDVDFPSHTSLLDFISQFTNLTSLEYHSAGDKRNQVETFHCIVDGLRKLKHFSWAMNPYSKYLNVPGKCWGETAECHSNQTLTSLELVVYDDSSLSNDAMRSLTRLQSLTVLYMDSHEGCRLKTWLAHIHHLSTLVVDGGPPPRQYARSIPSTVTSLTMCVSRLTSADLAAVASQVPGLLHLQLDPWPAGCHTGLMLKLFPVLQSIKLRIWQVGEKNFLDFYRFQSMKRIEVMDAADSPRISELSCQLQTRTHDRIRVVMSTRRRGLMACYHQMH